MGGVAAWARTCRRRRRRRVCKRVHIQQARLQEGYREERFILSIHRSIVFIRRLQVATGSPLRWPTAEHV